MSDTIQDTPPKTIVRNEFGLIKGMNYVFDENGKVDWRKMVKPEYLVPNKQKTQETDITKLEDKDLLILLPGIKHLAELRGFTEVGYRVVTSNPTFCSVICNIDWLPNYETENRRVLFSSMADASLDNVDGFFQKFLTTLAENRAFVRCVRSFLRINIVGKEEICEANKEETSPQSNPQVALLQKEMNDKGITWEQFKKVILIEKDKLEGAEAMTSLNDLPKDKLLDYIARIKKVKNKA